MIVPVLTSLDTVPAADAFGRIEEYASCFAIAERRGWNKAAVLLNKSLGRAFHCLVHAPMYHFFFAAVNYWLADGEGAAELKRIFERRTRVEQEE